MKTVAKFRYPYFESINWFAARHLLQEINELNVEERKCPDSLLVGLKALLSTLKHWNTEKDVSKNCMSRNDVTLYFVSITQIRESRYHS